MRCLTKQEELLWLQKYNLPAAPYANQRQELQNFHYIQFYPPKDFCGIECFINSLLENLKKEHEIMLSVEDTVFAFPYDLRLIENLRKASGETLRTIDKPAHVFTSEEQLDVIGMFALSTVMGWQTYLYMPESRSVLFNWEGNIFDFWTADSTIFTNTEDLIKNAFKLRKTGTSTSYLTRFFRALHAFRG